MQIPIFQVDAFTDTLFKGNPAAVCPLDAWLGNDVLQAIAYENNLSETAYFVKKDEGYHLRWFTPTKEIPLCGHATLAAAFVLFQCLGYSKNEVIFYTESGSLLVTKFDGFLTMDFPSIPAGLHLDKNTFELSLGVKLSEVRATHDKALLCITRNEDTVRNFKPNYSTLKDLDYWGIFLTAPGNHVDFVSRVFAPKMGIDEDPVTGSAHCTLTPYWAARLGKSKLKARQISQRGGEIICEIKENRIFLSGSSVLYMKGELSLNL